MSLRVLIGPASGALIALVLTPLLTRLYSPETFGMFAVLVAVVAVLTGASTMRMEISAQGAETDGEAKSLLRLARISSLVVAVAATIITLTMWAAGQLAPYWLLTGPLLLLTTMQPIGTAHFTRVRNYQGLSIAGFMQQAGTALMQIAVGMSSPSVLGLAVGFGSARLAWLKSNLAEWRGSAAGLKPTWRRHRSRAGTGSASAIINSASGQVLILVGSLVYGASGAGIIAIALRVLIAPLAMIADAVTAAAMGEIGQQFRSRRLAGAVSLTKRAMRDQALLGTAPILIIAIAMLMGLDRILGSEWTNVGIVVAALAPGALAQFISSPFAQLLNLIGAHKVLLRWDAFRLAGTAGPLVFAALVGAPLQYAALAFSISQIVVYGVLVVIVLKQLEKTGAQTGRIEI